MEEDEAGWRNMEEEYGGGVWRRSMEEEYGGGVWRRSMEEVLLLTISEYLSLETVQQTCDLRA